LKKRITAILLSALLVANLSACGSVSDNRTKNEESNTVTEETNQTESSAQTDQSQVPPSESETNKATIRDVPSLGQLTLRQNYQTASIWIDQEGEFYIYFNEWDTYRELKGLSSYPSIYISPYWYESDNNIVVDCETATIAIISEPGKHGEPTILTYHFNRNNNLVELHVVPLKIIETEYDLFFINMHDADHGYYFLLPRSFPNYGFDWPLIMFETTDGGKSWNQIATHTFHASARYEEIFKFISPQVGIISFRDLGACEVWERTYFTVDGGLTWTQMSKLPHGEIAEWYSEIIDLEYVKDYDYYRLTVKASNYTSFQIQFWSKDLINWTLIES